ncbi:hypothetical protein [Sulfurimonas sp.]
MKNTSSFLAKIRKDKIKQPTQRGFSLDKWTASYYDCIEQDNTSMQDMDIFVAGTFFYSLFNNIRLELDSLYKKNNPFISYTDILKAYVALSNRDRYILSGMLHDKIQDNSHLFNLFSTTIQTHGNEVVLDDIATGCVDGMSKAISVCIKNVQKKKKLVKGNKPVSKLSFLKKEAYLSQLYHTYEVLWKTIIWSDFQFTKIKDDIYGVFQPDDDYQKAIILSEQRKVKLTFSAASLVPYIKEADEVNKVQKYLVKSKSFRDERIVHASRLVQKSNKMWILDMATLEDYFSNDMMNYKYKNKFSVMDIQMIFKHLSLLAYQYNNDYEDTDIGEHDIAKLHSFCPVIKKIKLIKGLTKVTKYSYLKIKEILDFLEYKGEESQDLWANPFMSISSSEYVILTSALQFPNLARIIEYWFKELQIDMAEKGFKYEKTVVENFNQIVSENELIQNFDKAVSREIKIQKKKEEIDFLCRIGDKILLGELKSIVTVDSPISEYNTYNILKGASEQVLRKSKFVMENLQQIFKFLDWQYEENKKYEIIGFILNSSSSFVGYNIHGIPICDGKILNKYFAENRVPIFSQIEKGEVNHYAIFKLYENFEELTKNLKIYLEHPPQIRVLNQKFKPNITRIPALKNQKERIVFLKLIPEEFNPKELLKQEFPFKIETMDGYEQVLENVDMIN